MALIVEFAASIKIVVLWSSHLDNLQDVLTRM
jgi:hypothetical protein